MIDDIKCPYCGAEQEINHDDGYGYEEGIYHKQECGECEKVFTFTTSIIYYYESFKADCLNGAKHNHKPSKTYPLRFTKMKCVDCEDERQPSSTEMAKILSGEKL